MIFAATAFAQTIAPTTPEEYNYGVAGYKIQLNAKLDTKEGYRLKPAPGCEDATRKIEYQLLYRQEESLPCAVFMIYTRLRNPPLYFCIPTPDASAELWDKFYNSLTIGTDNPQEQQQFFSYCIARLTMHFASGKQ
jgi:hypothetical protein